MIEREYVAMLVITYAIYAVFLAGVWMVFGRDIALMVEKRKRLFILREYPAQEGKKARPVKMHIQSVLFAAFGSKAKIGRFYAFSILCAASTVILSLSRFAPATCLFTGLTALMMPYVICRILAESRRGASSAEAEALVSALLNEYRIKGGNIVEALEGVLAQTKELRSSKRFVFELLSGLQNAKNDEMRKEAAETFARALGTRWGRMLSENIHNAVCLGIEISLSLEDIIHQMKDARKLQEERNRLNAESVRMVRLLIPAAYMGTLFMGVKFTGTGWNQLLHNQFATKEGFFLFFMIVCMFFLNVLLVEIVRNKRFDF